MLGQLASAVRAAAGRLDRNPALAMVLRAVRRRLPGQHIDPLRLTPALTGQLNTPLGASAGARPSALGELSLMAIQLRHAHTRSCHDTPAGELTVVFTDLSGFSDWTLQVGDATAVGALRRVSTTIEPLLAARGTLVKRLGDGLMVVYPRADDAVHAALLARDAVSELDLDGHRLALRAGIHTGRPTPLGGDFYGRDVNIAARLTDLAGPGQIALSETTQRRLGEHPEQYWTRSCPRLVRTHGVPDRLTAHILPHPNPLTPERRSRPVPHPRGGHPGGGDPVAEQAPVGIDHPEDFEDFEDFEDDTLMCSIGILMERCRYDRSDATLLLLDWAHHAGVDPARLARWLVDDTTALAHGSAEGSGTGG